jgi:hypothetical protein
VPGGVIIITQWCVQTAAFATCNDLVDSFFVLRVCGFSNLQQLIACTLVGDICFNVAIIESRA